jgi:hypothetical protein
MTFLPRSLVLGPVLALAVFVAPNARADDTAPAGENPPKTSHSQGLLIGGAVTFGVSYGLTLVMTDFTGCDARPERAIPVVGYFVSAAMSHPRCPAPTTPPESYETDRAIGGALLYGSAVIGQLVGAALIGAALLPSESRAPSKLGFQPRLLSMGPLPPGGGAVGLAVSGSLF